MSQNAEDIIPENFDLARARAATSSTPESQRKRCPNPDCNSTNINKKSGRWDSPQAHPGRWWCKECSTHFDTPAEGLP